MMLIRFLLMVFFSGAVATASARPDLSLPSTPNIAQRGSSLYRFTQLDLDSVDAKRHYRVWVGVPKRAAPAAGYPALYMLDGNAVLAALDDQLLGQVHGDTLPVLVLIGYAVNARFDVVARAYDDTPGLPLGTPSADDRPSGGADQFALLIEQRVKPAVAALAKVDPQRQTLWGHSFGGLFALHVLFTHTHDFQAYAVADPSVWWGNGVLLGEQQKLAPANRVRLLMMRGTAPKVGRGPAGASEVSPEAARQLAEGLAGRANVTVDYQELVLSHGAMFNASLLPALRFATEQ
ncbi:alpha/beta hydrolase-fold protein [Pseudomonas sp.]|uniref:alpha/beta hydrolase n=1 Tax=Pseudomonas sp. TaxID=306 RepID=UPI002582C922|nr:alpha/beta hydrolase-fold protein [Pseudomonas sp.]